MYDPSLSSSARAKLARADEHLGALYDRANRWGDLNPFTIGRQSNADGSEHVFRVYIDPPPDVWRWGVLLGDALHNLRGALDNIVYGLAVRHTNTGLPTDDAILAFPVCSSHDRFVASCRCVRSLSEPARAAVERLQPYNRGKGSTFWPLWWLAQLNNVDKHRLVVPFATWAHPDEIAVDAPDGTFQVLWNRNRLEHGAPVLRLRLNRPDPNVRVRLDATTAVAIKVDEHPPIGLIPTMEHIRQEVGVAVRYLALFF